VAPPYSLLFDLFVLNSRVRTYLTRALAGTPLTAEEYAVYSILFEQGPTPPTQLAQIAGMPATTMSDYIRALLRRGHAEKRPHPSDARSYLLALTPEGLEAQRATGRRFRVAMRLVETSLDDDLAEVTRSVRAFAEAVRRASADLPD
jgi:DNA-binding MarR family transcriptional regulator